MTTAASGSRTRTVSPGVREAGLAVLGVGAAAILLAGVVADRSALLGALVATLLVLVFFLLGALTVNVVAGRMPGASLLVALLTYTLQVALLGIVFWRLSESGMTDATVDPTWLGVTTIVGTLTWTAGQLLGTARARQPVYDLRGDER